MTRTARDSAPTVAEQLAVKIFGPVEIVDLKNDSVECWGHLANSFRRTDYRMLIKLILFVLLLLSLVCVPTTSQTGLPERIVHRESGIKLVLIPAGRFQMGSPESEPDRSRGERQHLRIIREPFYMSETEVTVAQFRKFVEATKYVTDAERGVEEGGHHKGAFATVADGEREWSETASWRNPYPNFKEYKLRDDHPVVQVSWNDASRFVEYFALQLPTEAHCDEVLLGRLGGRWQRLWQYQGRREQEAFHQVDSIVSVRRWQYVC
jgi:formylglycine-generating enzyme required for sulfatase activity